VQNYSLRLLARVPMDIGQPYDYLLCWRTLPARRFQRNFSS